MRKIPEEQMLGLFKVAISAKCSKCFFVRSVKNTFFECKVLTNARVRIIILIYLKALTGNKVCGALQRAAVGVRRYVKQKITPPRASNSTAKPSRIGRIPPLQGDCVKAQHKVGAARQAEWYRGVFTSSLCAMVFLLREGAFFCSPAAMAKASPEKRKESEGKTYVTSR